MKRSLKLFVQVIICFLIALLFNAMFFFAIPVLNSLFFDKGEKNKVTVSEITEIEMNVTQKKQEPKKKILKKVIEQPNNFKATKSLGQNRNSGFKMDLSLAKGEASGDGVGVAIGNSENIIYEAGEVDEEAKILKEVAPKYPERAKKMGVVGYVKVFLVIDTYGNVSSAEIVSVEPAGYGFDTEALNAVRQWKFEPAKLKTFPVSQKAIKEFRFAR